MPRILLLLVFLLPLGLAAAPAPWYQWRSLLDGTRVCAQTSPGEGWARADGPYSDAACRRPLHVIRL
ncbi:hypothetical protein [Xylophilus sp. ASV27]|uniref:hypothetical protein n=1 Tax=Xylophilus sp. ASV27 TaxID=2795129 RepID=UPI001E54EA7E|nr:hypothetical protein [Xylophilus sp. ASV27]